MKGMRGRQCGRQVSASGTCARIGELVERAVPEVRRGVAGDVRGLPRPTSSAGVRMPVELNFFCRRSLFCFAKQFVGSRCDTRLDQLAGSGVGGECGVGEQCEGGCRRESTAGCERQVLVCGGGQSRASCVCLDGWQGLPWGQCASFGGCRGQLRLSGRATRQRSGPVGMEANRGRRVVCLDLGGDSRWRGAAWVGASGAWALPGAGPKVGTVSRCEAAQWFYNVHSDGKG
jgi:hypothetical protein